MPTDELLTRIADYVFDKKIHSQNAYKAATLCLADAIGCAIASLKHPECVKLLGPIIPGTTYPFGSRVIGTGYILDPILAAFNIGIMIRWLDYNDTWLAKEWGHPSDNFGGILAIADFISRQNSQVGKAALHMQDVLTAAIKAYEIQGILALENSFNEIGFDHVILVKVATAAVVTHLLGGSKDQIVAAISQAWIDTGPLRTYRHAPLTGSRKSWAAGDATRRGVELSLLTKLGEMGYPQALSSPKWGFYDVLLKGKPLTLSREFDSYVMENILFKISFPAEFHAQTAVECALKLYPEVKNRLDQIQKIELQTHLSAIRIIDKKGPLKNFADRDHCIQYMIATALIHGNLKAEYYGDELAKNPLIDKLRDVIEVKENPKFSEDYLKENKRSIANSLTIFFNDQTHTETVTIEYPLGHPKRREEAKPLLFKKFYDHLESHFPKNYIEELVSLFKNSDTLGSMPVHLFVDYFCKQW